MKILTLLLWVVVSAAVLPRSNGDEANDHHKAINENQRNTLMNSLDRHYTPCTNFYTYACRKCSEGHTDKSYNPQSVAGILGYEINLELMDYLEKTPEANVPRFVQLVKDFYVACQESPEFEYLSFMHWMEEEENMKWALFTADASEDFVFDWTATSAMFRKYGFNNIFLSESRVYQDDSDTFITHLNMPNYYKTFEYIISSEMEEYKNAIPLPGGTMNFEDLGPLVNTLERKLYGIKVENQEKPTLLKFHELPYPWLQSYLKALWKLEVIDDDTEISIDNMAYMEVLDNLLKDYDAKFLARYIEIRFLQIAYKLIKSPVKHVYMTLTRSLLPMATEWIYQQLHPELLHEIPKIEQIFETMVKGVNKTLNMGETDVLPKEFVGKLGTMHMKVGNLPRENARDILESYYADLKLSRSNYYHNYLKVLEFYYKLERSYIGDYKSEDEHFFYKTPKHDYKGEVHPVYVPAMNLLILPLGLLRPPVYHADFEDIFKQSSLSTLMAMSVFDAFGSVADFPAEDVEHIAGVTSLYTSFQVFFSSLSAEEIVRYQTMFGFGSLQELKQLFFLNAIHYKCHTYSRITQQFVNFAVRHLSEFAEAYDCKLNNFVRMF